MPAKSIDDMPARIARLPVDRRGYPIPCFVEDAREPGAERDFRIMNPRHYALCVRHRRCWICGEPLGANLAFTVGPMCCVNLISSEPPSHRECARYAAKVCPFLTIPAAKRREAGMPDEGTTVGGLMIKRNPGVTAIWMTKTYKLQQVDNGVVIHMGEPHEIEFWSRGRAATRAEVDEAVASGLPALAEVASEQGPEAERELLRAIGVFEARLDAILPKPVEVAA